MKTKQILSIALALLMLLTIAPLSVFAAEPKVITFTSSKTEVAPGDEFVITVMMPELALDIPWYFGGNLRYDDTQIEFVELKQGGYLITSKEMDSLANEKDSAGSYIYFSVTEGSVVDATKDLFTVTFKVKDGATGTVTLTPVISEDDFFDDNLDNIPFTTKVDTVTIKAAAPTTYTVTFDADGGTPVPTAQTVEENQKATEPTAPTKEGYTFDGWYNGETKYDFSTPVTAALTLKAKWTVVAATTYTVTFDANGGTPVPAAQTVEAGNTATEPTAPSKDDYDFDGWYNGDTKYVFSTAVSADLTLKAKWTAKAHTHTPAEAVKENEIAATCKAEGSFDEVVYCSVCGEEISRVTKTIEKLTTHTPAEAVKENEVAATCKAEGSYDEVIYCSVCGEKLSSEKKIVEKTAHTPADAVQENVVGATCTTAGSYDEVVYCSVCGEEISRVAHTGELIEHDWSEWKETTAPTCTTKGLRTRTCSVCGTEETEEIDVVDHEFEITNTVEATCEEDGYVVSICKICGKKNVETLKKLDHKWDDGAVTTEPTCLDDGEKTFTCLNDSTHTKTEKVAALGHDWGAWEVTKEATEEEEGEETRTCARCGEKETRTVAKVVPADDSTDDALIASLRYAAMILRQKRLAEEAAKKAAEEAAQKAAEEAAKKAAEEAAKNAFPFTDVTKNSPAYDDIKYAYDNGIMIGMSDTTFGEDIPLTRGMIVTVLWRMEGKPEVSYTGVFTDVPAGKWYTEGVEWAASKGIVLGYGDGTFGPEDYVTREQLAAILFRYAQYKGYDVSVGEDTNILSYYDAFTWGQWAVPALQWACGADAIEDSPVGMLRPTEDATRGEIAHAIHVFLEEVAK